MKANPMPALVRTWPASSMASTSPRGELTACPRHRRTIRREISFAGPGKRRRRTGAGDRRRCADQHRIVPRSQRLLASRQSLAFPRRRGARQSRISTQGLGHADGRRPAAVRRRCRACPGAAGRDRTGAVWILTAFISLPARRTCAPIDLRGPGRNPTNWRWLARDAPAPVRFLNIGGGFGIPYFPEIHGSTCPDRGEPSALVRNGRHSRIAAGPSGHRARPLHGRRSRHLRRRVVDRKISRGQVFLVTDGGLASPSRGIAATSAK